VSQSKVSFPGWEQRKRAWIAEISGRVAANMDAAAGYAAEEARKRAPVGRGIMKSDITHTVKARGNIVEGIVGVKKRAFWAWFVELGTVKMADQPFLRPAVFDNIKRIARKLEGR